MINFRYHVVSILAVFLSLAIGTVMGASFVGRGVIDRLNDRINTVRTNTKEIKAANEKLQSDVDKLRAYRDQTASFTVGRSLTGLRVNLVAERGVDGGVVDAQAALLRDGGATVAGVIWLEDNWKMTTAADAAALRTATGLTTRGRAALRAGAAQLLGKRLGAAPEPAADPAAPPTTLGTAPADPAPAKDLLTELATAEFITLGGVAGSPTPSASAFVAAASRVLALGGPGHDVPLDVVPAIAVGVESGGTPAVVAQAFTESETTPDRGSWIDAIADSDALRGRVSTVDDVETVEGRVGAALALAELSLDTVGNYGMDRERAVPEKLPAVPSAR